MAKQRNRKPARRRDKKGGPGSGRRKPCLYCKDKIEQVDYKDVDDAAQVHLRARQDPLAPHHAAPAAATRARSPRAVKRARELALLPYAAEARDERGDRRRPRRPRPRPRPGR